MVRSSPLWSAFFEETSKLAATPGMAAPGSAVATPNVATTGQGGTSFMGTGRTGSGPNALALPSPSVTTISPTPFPRFRP